MMESLYEKLVEYSQEDIYPFHMPGHKRKKITEEKTYSIDITEIDGFDNLQNPEGIIREMEENVARLYRTQNSLLLINGSSAGLLAAISSVCNYGEKILVGRNSHKSVFHAISLRGLKATWLYPEICRDYGIYGGILPKQVESALEKEPDIRAVLITSPTYDGVVSDIEKIAEIVHNQGKMLIVDEAHGAHLPFSAGLFPKSALECGADLVVHSLHKTLPSYTQTGLLHVNSDRVDIDRLTGFLNMYQSTSPSYILMGGIGTCLKWLQEKGKEAFPAYETMLQFWRREYETICEKEDSFFKLVGKEITGKNGVFDFDVSKLIFSTRQTGASGKELYEFLLEKQKLQLEMMAKDYVLALSSVCDDRKGFERLQKALLAANQYFEKHVVERESMFLWEQPEVKMTLGEALDKEKKWCPLEKSEGKISGNYVYLYPPGIPLILPGEVIGVEFIQSLETLKKEGFSLVGIKEGKIKII